MSSKGSKASAGRLDREVTDKTRTGNIFLPHFDRQSRIYPLIDSLGAATDLAQLKTLATVTDTETQTILPLKAEIEALQTTNPAAQLQLAQTLKQHLDALIKSFATIGHFDIQQYAHSLERLRNAEQQYEKATQESFAGLPIPGLLQEE